LISLSPEIRRQSLIAGLLAFLLLMAGVYGQAPIGFGGFVDRAPTVS
jgi:hypothetical protein